MEQKYLKYKHKYLMLKNKLKNHGGSDPKNKISKQISVEEIKSKRNKEWHKYNKNLIDRKEDPLQ